MILAFYGAGALGREFKYVADETGDWPETVFFDDHSADVSLLGCPVVGFQAFRKRYSPEDTRFVITIGEPKFRREAFDRMEEAGYQGARLIHPSAYISPDAVVGEGAVIGPGVFIGSLARIGKDYLLGKFCGNPKEFDYEATKEHMYDYWGEESEDKEKLDEIFSEIECYGEPEYAETFLRLFDDENDGYFCDTWEMPVYVYSGDQERICQVFAECIQPEVKRLVAEAKTFMEG